MVVAFFRLGVYSQQLAWRMCFLQGLCGRMSLIRLSPQVRSHLTSTKGRRSPQSFGSVPIGVQGLAQCFGKPGFRHIRLNLRKTKFPRIVPTWYNQEYAQEARQDYSRFIYIRCHLGLYFASLFC